MTSPKSHSLHARKRLHRHVFIGVVAAILAGCASLPTPPAVSVHRPASAPPADGAWWYVRFHMEWPEDADPAWHTDVLIAHRVVKPVLDQHLKDIWLWRFHRRAARDAAGHQFSFIFFASPETASRVNTAIFDNPTLQQARSSGRIVAIIYDDPASVSRPGIADTSDPAWSAALRQAWPYYMMGASQTWLDLIAAINESEPSLAAPPTFAELDHRYARINAAITMLWQNEGRHAFLHHLNALFGYEPVVIIEKRHMRF